jgi:hypothetical protein
VRVDLYPGLSIGDQTACVEATHEVAVVHACEIPGHQQAVGYQGSLPPDHPHYLMRWCDYDLYLNLIGPPTPLFKLESFKHFLNFAHARAVVQKRSLLIYCCRCRGA